MWNFLVYATLAHRVKKGLVLRIEGNLLHPGHDTPTTFKVRVDNVLARVVVRDLRGKVVPNLNKQGFQLDDGRRRQTITSFATETSRTREVPLTQTIRQRSG